MRQHWKLSATRHLDPVLSLLELYPMIICHCYRITDSKLRSALLSAQGDVSEALYDVGLGEGCGGCTEAINEVCEAVRARLNPVSHYKLNIITDD